MLKIFCGTVHGTTMIFLFQNSTSAKIDWHTIVVYGNNKVKHSTISAPLTFCNMSANICSGSLTDRTGVHPLVQQSYESRYSLTVVCRAGFAS